MEFFTTFSPHGGSDEGGSECESAEWREGRGCASVREVDRGEGVEWSPASSLCLPFINAVFSAWLCRSVFNSPTSLKTFLKKIWPHNNPAYLSMRIQKSRYNVYKDTWI